VGVLLLLYGLFGVVEWYIFLGKKLTSFMQALLRVVYWLWFWSLLQREDMREYIRVAISIGNCHFAYIYQERMEKQ
jgi:hypothetical protein